MHPPRLETVENLMKLSQMIIQGVWETKTAFLMLPHISQDQLRHFSTKKVSEFFVKGFKENYVIMFGGGCFYKNDFL